MKTWIKYKYTAQKTTGRYRSHHDDGARRRSARRRATDKQKTLIQQRQPVVTLVIRPNGKRVFVREARAT